MVSLHVSTLGRAGGVSARMVVSHLDVCSELVALAVRCGAGPDADRVRSRAAAPHAAAARTGARPRDWRFGFGIGIRHGVEMCSGVRGR